MRIGACFATFAILSYTKIIDNSWYLRHLFSYFLLGIQWVKGSLTGATTKIDYYPVSFTSTCYGIFISDAFGYLAVGAEVINNTCFKIYTTGNIGYAAFFIGK